MNTIPRRYVLAGQTVARRVPRVMSGRGLEASISEWVLTVNDDRVWLFGVLNLRKLERLERYTAEALVHHLSTACDGVPVYLSNTNGLRYGFLLSRRPRLPRLVNFPGCERGLVRLGVGPAGQPVAVRWGDLGHLLVAGMTGAGKSNFLRLLVHQAIGEGARLLLADLDGATFPMLRDHPALLADIANTSEDARVIVAHALDECCRRAALYQQVSGYPDKLEEYNAQAVKAGGDPLPRMLCVLDEFNATVTALGGHRGQFARDVAQLGWRGRKFGINLVFAAQDFTKSVIGRVRDQARAAICFRVRSAEAARAIGCAGAARIPETRPGRAMTDRWGVVQVYQFDKSLLVDGGTPAGILSEPEVRLVQWALEFNDGYLSLADLQERGAMGQGAARRLASDWERRGWLHKDKDAGNKRRVTAELEALASYNLQTSPQTQSQSLTAQLLSRSGLQSTNPTNPYKPPQTPANPYNRPFSVSAPRRSDNECRTRRGL